MLLYDSMKTTTLFSTLLLYLFTFNQQQTLLSRGRVFGVKPDTTAVVDAAKLEAFMGKRSRISVTIRARVTKVTRQKGGWFEMDAGNGRTIAAHFRQNNISVPTSLAGKYILVQGVAQKQFIADDGQHFAGDTARGKKQHGVNANRSRRLTFEVSGLMIYK